MLGSHADRVAAVARQVSSRPAGAKITIRKNTPAHSIRDQAYSWDEIRAAFPERYARYEHVRRDHDADAAFLHIRDKVVWVDPAAADPGKIPVWRLYRSYGRRWYLNPLAYLVLGVALLSKAVWRTPAGLR